MSKDRDENGKFIEGNQAAVSKGRPKSHHQLKELYRLGTIEAHDRLKELMYDEDKNVSLKAVIYYINRGWGAPPQSIQDENGNKIGNSGVTIMVGASTAKLIPDAIISSELPKNEDDNLEDAKYAPY